MTHDLATFVISLPEATARRGFMTEQLTRLGLDFQFFDAVDGRSFDVPAHPAYDARRRRMFFGRDMTGGEIGCLLSHRGIYAHMIAQNIPVALVFEDDAIIHDDLPRVVEALLNTPHCPDLVRFLGSEKVARLRQKTLFRIDEEYTVNQLCTTPGGAHAYLITLAGARVLAQAMQRNYLPVDTLMGQSWLTGLTNVTVQSGLAVHDLAQESFIGDARFDKREQSVKPWYYPISRAGYKLYEGVMKRICYGII